MLKLRDFLHLPQLDSLMSQLIADGPGLILLAGIDARSNKTLVEAETNLPARAITPSGLSAIFNILIQEILLANPQAQALVVAEDRALARVPRQFKRRVGLLLVEPNLPYTQQILAAAAQRPGLLVIDRLTEETAPAAFEAAGRGVRVLTQIDTVLRGASVARQLLDLGVARGQLSALGWVLSMQRMGVLCQHCKHPVELTGELAGKIASSHPHLGSLLDEFLRPAPAAARSKVVRPPLGFFQALGCPHCRGSGYQGDIAIFDLFRHDPASDRPFVQPSLLSLEEYALYLASEGQLDLNDLIELDNEHLRRTYQMLTNSERALTRANMELSRKLLELEASNRVLIQRTEVLVSLQDLGQALISSSDLGELAERVCRRASELCGADRVVLYLRRLQDSHQESAQVLAVRGWDRSAIGLMAPPAQVFDGLSEGRLAHFIHSPPGVRPQSTEDGRIGRSVLSAGVRVPLLAQDQLVGVMIIQSTQKDAFTPGQTALLQTFANQAALAIQRAGLIDELRGKINQLQAAQAELVTKERTDRELELAHQVQQSMLPHSFPVVPGYVLAARNEPARAVGGDFYDMFVLDDDHFGIVVADVADKGMPAALYMALTRSLLLAEARRERSPRQVLLNVNRLLLELGDLNGFVSVFYGIVECSAHRLVYARAGHERPLLLRAGEVIRLGGEGMVLGVQDSSSLNLNQQEQYLLPGDRLILYSDGLTDVADDTGAFFSLARLVTLFQMQTEKPIDALCQAIFDGLAQFRGQAEQFDDMTLLVLDVSLL